MKNYNAMISPFILPEKVLQFYYPYEKKYHSFIILEPQKTILNYLQNGIKAFE